MNQSISQEQIQIIHETPQHAGSESDCSAQRAEFWISVLGVFPSGAVAVMGSWRGVGCLVGGVVGVMSALLCLGSVVGVMFVRGVCGLASSSGLGWLWGR